MMAGSIRSGYLLSGRYRVKDLIGVGAQSSVYHAVDELLSRDVAVKLFRQHHGNLEQVRRQEAEARILAGMSHPALVTLFDAGADLSDPLDPLSYLVMELVRGPDLRSRGTLGPMPAASIAHLGHDLADGLAYIHHHGIVHRDVKPANVLLVEDGRGESRPRAKLSDFGVALLLGKDHETFEGAPSGTPHYLSPEQAAGEPSGPASDVYSLGLVLLEGLTGKITYPGAPIQSALARLLHDPYIPEEIAPTWVALLTYMLSRDPAARPSAREVSLALRQEIASSAGRRRTGSPDSVQDEEARMRAVHRYRILDTLPDGTFDRVVSVAARMFQVPVAIVSIVDHDRIWFKARYGTDVEQVGRDPGLCASAILQDEAWVVESAATDPRTLANPLVAGEAGMQFYAGVPLRTPDGYNLGTLCVLDQKPREFTDDDISTLENMAAIVMNDLELRLQTRRSYSHTEAAASR
ncbi:GAF domain-containing serine/threonine-protein kinase [Arthrobacter sp. ZGTC412]|uniref:GAF domain-containing serine/threonine-protein kinase n=1 Tax=Arthrobacter sp. ZGTC412 TaxID=2058900 RepID=UPI0027D3475B|nr:protein kinase [Arthrobacter sp. ZGTC412]